MVLSLLSSRNSKLRYPVAEWVAVKGSHAQPQSWNFRSHSLLPPTAQSHTQHHQIQGRLFFFPREANPGNKVSQQELENCLVQPNSGILGVSSPNKKFYTILAGLEPTIKEKHIRTQHCSQVGAEVTQKPSPDHQMMVLWFQVVRGRREGASLWGPALALGLAEAERHLGGRQRG